MTREELIKRIALKMDEISSSDDVITPVGTGDNNPLYTQINNLLNESVNDVLMKAPIYRLSSHIVAGKAEAIDTKLIKNTTRYSAQITVPDDFLRLGSITDDNFERPIVELAMEGDDISKRQHNKHLVAKSAKPVAVLGTIYEGGTCKRVITCYSYDSNTTVSPSLYYIKRYDEDNDTSAEIALDDYMVDIASWVCAGKVFASQGNVNGEKICSENAVALMI